MVRGRGRGRGRSVHRGGRRGISRRGARGGIQNIQTNIDIDAKYEDIFNWKFGDDDNIDSKLRKLFLSKAKFSDHYEAQNRYSYRYFAYLHALIKNHVHLLESSKAIALAVAWARKDFRMAKYLLKMPNELFGIKEVLKALQILDAARNKRAHEKLLKRLEAQGCKKQKKLALLKSMIGSLAAEIPPVGSVSGSLICHVKDWVKSIPVERLEFYAMYFPPDAWKKLADICHLHPEKDIPQCPWFLKFCFGEGAMQGNFITAENISERIMEEELDYTVIRKFHENLTPKAKERIASYACLDTVIWYYEELGTPDVDKVIFRRLKNGEKINLPYGKLMERIMYFSNIEVEDSTGAKDFVTFLMSKAEKNLKSIKFDLESPLVVIGDMSASMDVAIRTSNIIASLVTAVTNADLVFFDNENVIAPFIPKDVKGVIKLSETIKARNSTVPAVSLYPYYINKKVVKTFVVVTDEGENGSHEGYRFAQLFKKYHDEVHPAKLVFISFLSQCESGQMVDELKEVAPDIKPLQFRLNGERPDLTKLDHIFSLLSSENEAFSEQVNDIEKALIENKLENPLESLVV